MFYLNKIKIPPRESSERTVSTTATAAVTVELDELFQQQQTAAVTVDWGTRRTVFTTATAAVFVDW